MHRVNNTLTDHSIVMLVQDQRIDRRVLDQARSLQGDGWRVTVIAGGPPFPGYTADEEAYPDVEIVRINPERCANYAQNGLNLEALNAAVAKFPVWPWAQIYTDFIYFLLEGAMRPASIIVGHDLPMFGVAAYLAMFHDSMLVYDSHELYPDQMPDNPLLSEVLSKMEESLLPFAKRILTVNRSMASIISQKYGIPLPEVILNAPNYDQKLMPLGRQYRFHEEFALPKTAKVLLYQGFLDLESRNLENLIKGFAMCSSPGLVLVFMGAGSRDGERDRVMQIAGDTGLLNQRIFFHEHVGPKELLSYTASADIGIIPYLSRDRNFEICTPNKLFEFLVAGIPIISSDLTELKRFVSGNLVGVNYKLETAPQVAEAIDNFTSQHFEKCAIRAKQISKNFVWEHQGKKVVEIFRSIIGEKSSFDPLERRLQIIEVDIRERNLEAACERAKELVSSLEKAILTRDNPILG